MHCQQLKTKEDRLANEKSGKVALILRRINDDHSGDQLQPREIAREFGKVSTKGLSATGSELSAELHVPTGLPEDPIIVISSQEPAEDRVPIGRELKEPVWANPARAMTQKKLPIPKSKRRACDGEKRYASNRQRHGYEGFAINSSIAYSDTDATTRSKMHSVPETAVLGN